MRKFLITGSSRGIGRAAAIALARKGFYCVIHYRHDKDGALKTLAEVQKAGSEGTILSFDVSKRQECQSVLEQHISKNGAFYGIVVNAGITADAAFPAMTPLEWDSVIHTDLDGFYNVVQPCVMPMIGLRDGGRIIAVSSVSGLCGNRGQVNYSAAKAGLIGAVKALAIELAKRDITVNAVAPGLIDTAMADLDERVKSRALEMIPLKRMGTAEEVASLIAYLAGDEASYITRQVISVNGGML